MRYVSLFSGIEAATAAWEPLGWEATAFSEIDPFPCAVLSYRFPGVPNLGDVSGVDWGGFKRERGVPDVVVGGSPCQSFSVAGKREGLEGASGLMWEFVRACDQLRPRWVVWENVPGALSSSGGEDFRCLLGSLDELGYCVAWRVLDAQFFGVPQRRRRVFLVGSLGDGRAAEVLIEPEGVLGNPRSSREKRAELAAGAGVGASCAGFSYKAGGRAGSIGFEEEVAPSLIAGRNDAAVFALQSDGGTSRNTYGSGWSADGSAYTLNTVDRQAIATSGEVRRLTPRECERLQGFPDGWTLVPYRGKPAEECPDAPRYKALGNSMAVPVMGWIGRRIDAAERRGDD